MSDKPLEVFVLYATDAEQKFIKIAGDGCLAIFEDEISAKRAKRKNPGTDYKPVSYYSQKQVARLQSESETGLVEALEGLLPFVVNEPWECRGYKCRELWCISCYGEEEACESAAKAKQAIHKAVSALAAYRKQPEVRE